MPSFQPTHAQRPAKRAAEKTTRRSQQTKLPLTTPLSAAALATLVFGGLHAVSPAQAAETTAPSAPIATAPDTTPGITPPATHWAQASTTAPSAGTASMTSHNLPAGPLGAALASFAAGAGISISIAPDLVDGKTSPALQGRFTPADGLARLLQGSGLSAVEQEHNTWVLRRTVVQHPAAPAADRSLGPVTVTESADLPGELPKSYAGGQVARGGRVGVLGNKDFMDTPFSQQSYTAQLVEELQARTLNDVLKVDAAVQTDFSSSSGITFFSVRGLSVSNNDLLLNGLSGIAPGSAEQLFTEPFERIELLRGPATGLYGGGSGPNIGGTVNLVPKRAGDTPTTRLNVDYAGDSRLGGHLDWGRRFGDDQRFGVRFNGVYRDGDTAIDRNSIRSGVAALALDYRGERFRAALDTGYQNQLTQGTRRPILAATGFDIPAPPDNRTNTGQPWEFNDSKSRYATLGGEFDLAPQATLFATGGRYAADQLFVGTVRRLIDQAGTLAAGSASVSGTRRKNDAFDGGIRGQFSTGSIAHHVTLGYNWLERDSFTASSSPGVPASNIYSPRFGDAPAPGSLPNPGNSPLTSDLRLRSLVVSDTLSMYGNRLQMTLGARHQTIESKNFNPASGAVTDAYDKSAVTPFFGLIVKPWPGISLYANFSEALAQGPVAPDTAVNAGKVFAPTVNDQYEIGVKRDFGRLTASVSLFQITAPNAFVDPTTNVFGVDGEQRNRGVEFNIAGELRPGVRLIGGATSIDAKLTKTQGGINQGNDARGVRFRVVAGVDWDTPFLTGLTLNGLMRYNGSQFINVANSQKLPGYSVLDMGLRYRLPGKQGTTLRLNIDNLLNANKWVGTTFSQFGLLEPRTVTLSMGMDL